MNQSAQMRAYVAAHPGCTSTEVSAAIVAPNPVMVAKVLAKMAARGLLAVERIPRVGSRGPLARYTLVREAKAAMTPEEAKQRKLERNRITERKRSAARAALKAAMVRIIPEGAPKPAPVSIVAETFEEWLAKGGVPEVLPSRWAAPICRRQPAMPNRVSVAA